MDWIKEAGGNIETIEDAGITIHGIDFTGHPVLGGSEIARLGIAQIGERLVVGTHPAMLLRFGPGTPMKAVSDSGAYQRIKDSVGERAIFRAYFAGEFLARLLDAQVEGFVNRYGLPEEFRFLGGDIVGRLGPLFASISADQQDLSLELVSPSGMTPMASLFIFHDLAAEFLTEPRE
jgi:hypothetical protein